ncbi:MAG: enoyl-CoA hydratase-related protein [Candidatus Sericytochromatia bacterium]
MSEEKSLLNLTIENNVGIIKLNNPPVNVLNRPLLEQLDRLIDEVKDNSEIKVIVLTGEGSAFAAGADIKSMPELKADTGEQMALYGQKIFSKLENLDKVSICAINGVALGGGLELAMSCDIRIISEKAKVGQPEINLGIIPGYGGTQRLTRLVGKPKAKEIVLTGDNLSAQEAYEVGIATKITSPENLMTMTLELANKIASKGQVAVKASKKAIDEGFEQNLNDALKTEANYFGLVCDSEDKNEGVIAFMEKRKPNFKDK